MERRIAGQRRLPGSNDDVVGDPPPPRAAGKRVGSPVVFEKRRVVDLENRLHEVARCSRSSCVMPRSAKRPNCAIAICCAARVRSCILAMAAGDRLGQDVRDCRQEVHLVGAQASMRSHGEKTRGLRGTGDDEQRAAVPDRRLPVLDPRVDDLFRDRLLSLDRGERDRAVFLREPDRRPSYVEDAVDRPDGVEGEVRHRTAAQRLTADVGESFLLRRMPPEAFLYLVFQSARSLSRGTRWPSDTECRK